MRRLPSAFQMPRYPHLGTSIKVRPSSSYLVQYFNLCPATTQNLFQRQDLRAFHGSEIPLVFGTYNHSGLVPTHREILLSKFIQTAWVSFARDPVRGLVDVGWPRYSSTGAGYAQIGNAKNSTGLIVGNAFATDATCSLGDVVVLNNTSAQLMSLLV
jgi:carboxylesterase type B